VGVRSGTREEYELIRRHKLLAAPGAESFPALLERFGDRPVYLSVDVDGFDPALVPGTGTVEPGGLGWADFEALAALLRRRRVVGADLVELAPDLDPTGRSEVVAARIVRLLLLLLLGTGQAGDLARNE
jgi:agmatinase